MAVCPPNTANYANLTLKNLLETLGLPINFRKVEEPSSSITCLGIKIEAMQGTLSIPECKFYNVIIVGFIECKIDTNPLMCLSPRRESLRTGMGQHLKSASQGITKVGGLPA